MIATASWGLKRSRSTRPLTFLAFQVPVMFNLLFDHPKSLVWVIEQVGGEPIHQGAYSTWTLPPSPPLAMR